MSYISHVDYKKMMDGFKKGAPKKMLKEDLEQEGNAFTAGLAKAKKGQEFKIGDKAVKDTSNYDSSMEESHPANDQWHEEFQAAISQMGLAGEAEARVMKALDHTDPMTQYGTMPAAEAAAEFVNDLGIAADDYNDYEPDTDADYEEPRDDFDMAGGDFNDGEFWENEVKKLQEIAGIRSQDDGPEDDDEEAREKKAKKAEMDDEEAENAERDEVDEANRNVPLTINGKVVRTYTQNGDKSYNVKYDDGDTETIMVSDDGWDDINTLRKNATGLDEEAHADGSHMRNVNTAAKVVAEKHGAELKPLYDKYQAARKDPDHKVGNAAWKEYENAATNWCGHEMLEAGMKRAVVSNLLSGYGQYEDWAWEYMTAIGKELGGVSEKEKAMYANTDPNIADPINEGSDYNKIVPALKAKGIKYGMPEKEIIKAMAEVMKQEAGYTDREVRYYLGYEEDFIPDLLQALKDSERDMEEGLNMPPLQATGQTIVTNEDQAPYGFEVLSPDERKQLKEFIDSYKTIKAEISKLLEKAGKSGKIMEGTREDDEAVPAARPAHYNEPSKTPKHKSSNLGGNRTGLVMTKAEMWENEKSGTIADSLGEKLHSTFSKVTDMAIKQLVADGWDEDQAISFLQAEIEEKGKEATMSQYDM
jgi:hypothetical protein